MRIALSFPGCHRRGGVERIMVECANYLDGRGHDTHVFASDWDADVLKAGVERHHVPCRTNPPLLRLLQYARRSPTEIGRLNPPADVSGGYGVLSMPDAVIWVQSVHRAWLEISGRERAWKGRLVQRLNPIHPVILAMEQRCFEERRYRKLIVLSEQVKQDLIRFYRVPEADIVILPNGYAPEEFNTRRCNAMRETMRLQLGYKPADQIVIFVANELERKGFWPLLQAIADLNDPHIRLLVVGRVDGISCKAHIARLGMADRVRFAGSSSDVASYYAAADVFALPTQYEAWGLVIVEALACGLPVLTSRLAGAAIAVREGETGELLDTPRDTKEIARKLALLLDTAAGRSGLSPECIAESVSSYAWSHILQRYEAILAESASPRWNETAAQESR